MQIKAKTPDEYITQVPQERQEVFKKLRKLICDNIPKGFEETMNYGMIGYVVPHSIYPNGYHCNPKLPVPYMNIASQKNFIALYHSGIYASPDLLKWFTTEYAKYSIKLDMGKCCIRFKKLNEIPFKLIGELSGKMSVEEWVNLYEECRKK